MSGEPEAEGTNDMIKWRNESALDLYNLAAAIFLLASPWLFAHANQTAAIDLRTRGAVIAILSLAAMAGCRYRLLLHVLALEHAGAMRLYRRINRPDT